MSLVESFTTSDEDKLTNEFLLNGYVIKDVDNRPALDSMRSEIIKVVCKHLNISAPSDENEFLNTIHERVPVEKLNDLRLATYSTLNNLSWFRPTYFALARTALSTLVGNELAMQNKVNLSIQYPNDESSLLGVHADAWSGETPYQVVEWLPLVDVFDTKSMYILKPEDNRQVATRFRSLVEKGGSKAIYEEWKDRFTWLRVNYGQVLVFSPNLLHGNIVNRTPETRWSWNCRVTGLFTPYASDEKRLGTFYLPITPKPVTRVGMSYRTPEGFDG